MGRTLKMGSGIAMAAALAGAASAQTPKDPPPPASLENHDVETWADTYLRTAGWTLLTHNLEGAHLTSHHGVVELRDGQVELEIRTELFHPVTVGAGEARSGVARWSVDCQRNRLAILSMTAYAHNNLQGELGKKTIGVRAWREPNEGESATFGVICNAAKTRHPFTARRLAPGVPS